MTLSKFPEQDCDHTYADFDDWNDTYTVDSPVLRLIRTCPLCHEREEYTLRPVNEAQFMGEFNEWSRREQQGDIVDVTLQIEDASGLDASVHITIESGEATGVEVVSDTPYYFNC